MQINFYSSHLKISSPLKQKIEQGFQEIVERNPFLLKFKKEQQDIIQAKVIIKKVRSFHYFKKDFFHFKHLKKNNFKLTIVLFFSGRRIRVTDYGSDLYLLVNLVQRKLEREVHRFRDKQIDRKEKRFRFKKLSFRRKKHIC